ncbi:MAG TPA: hypothetical protein VKI44_15480 [Acetobacteraceae bacterium]|nr:hypothetical protein [Acetobacteraceae bacterium]
MHNISARAIRALALAAVLAIPTTAAIAAGESNGYLPLPPNGTVTFGGTLPSNSGEKGEPEAVNSLPPGFEAGTLGMQHRQALYSSWYGGAQSVAGR